jgi:hypothetical protein
MTRYQVWMDREDDAHALALLQFGLGRAIRWVGDTRVQFHEDVLEAMDELEPGVDGSTKTALDGTVSVWFRGYWYRAWPCGRGERCGTYPGYQRHVRRKEETCPACRESNRVATRARRESGADAERMAAAARDRARKRLAREFPERYRQLVSEELTRPSAGSTVHAV